MSLIQNAYLTGSRSFQFPTIVQYLSQKTHLAEEAGSQISEKSHVFSQNSLFPLFCGSHPWYFKGVLLYILQSYFRRGVLWWRPAVWDCPLWHLQVCRSVGLSVSASLCNRALERSCLAKLKLSPHFSGFSQTLASITACFFFPCGIKLLSCLREVNQSQSCVACFAWPYRSSVPLLGRSIMFHYLHTSCLIDRLIFQCILAVSDSFQFI